MNFQKEIEIIKAIEAHYDVNSITYNDVKLWPLIRLILTFNIMGHNNLNPPKIISIDGLQEKNELNQQIFKEFLDSLNINADCIINVRPNNKGWEKVENKDYQNTFSFLGDYIEKNNFNFNLFISESFEIDYPNSNKITRLNILYEYIRIKTLLDYALDSHIIVNFNILNDILNFSKKITSNLEYIKYSIISLIVHIDAYQKLFMKIKTKALFLECYYSTSNLALCYVATKNNIKSIDIQHAIQVDSHYMYTNFSCIPKEGYNLLPDYFWIWSDYKTDRIEQWSKKTKKHKILIGGNINHIFMKNRIQNRTIFYPKNKINIFIALGLDTHFKDYLLEVIEKSSDIYLWHFREHPGHSQNILQKRISGKMEIQHKIEYEYSTTNKLEDFCKDIDISISFGSTISFELRDIYKIPSIIIREDIKGIDNNGVYFVQNLNELLTKLNFISNNLEEIKSSIISEEIVIDENLINSSIQKILQ